jgi:hypothetical protein
MQADMSVSERVAELAQVHLAEFMLAPSSHHITIPRPCIALFSEMSCHIMSLSSAQLSSAKLSEAKLIQVMSRRKENAVTVIFFSLASSAPHPPSRASMQMGQGL